VPLVVLVVVASLLMAASGTSSVDRATTDPARTAQAAQGSCPHAGLTIVDHGQLRMPAGATPGATRLLVAVMSGGDGDADDYLKLAATANREGIAVLYPTGRAGSIWQISKRFGSSDVQVVADLLDRVEASGCFDPQPHLDHRRVERRGVRRAHGVHAPGPVRSGRRCLRGLPRPGSVPGGPGVVPGDPRQR
jgi:poly(3-hydroxybutyrate) depolymerase